MAGITLPFPDFTGGTTIVSDQVDQNNSTISTFLNNRNSGVASWDAVATVGTLSSSLTTSQIILGTTRTITLSATQPASASRVYTFPDAGANADVVMTESTQTINGTKTFAGQLIGKGASASSDAAAGYIGEALRATVLEGAAVSMTGSGQYTDITSISLTAGDWDLTGVFGATANGATVTEYRCGLSSTSGNNATGLVGGDNLLYMSTFPGSSSDSCTSIPAFRVSISSTTTYYLKMRMAYTVATPKGYGRISARRVR